MDIGENRAKMMGEEPIPKVLWKLAIPAIFGMLINAIYNIVDTFFIGLLNNTSAIAAVSVVLPLFFLIGAFGQMFGIGAASYISRLLGKKDYDTAGKTASIAFFTSLLWGLFISVLGILFIEEILTLIGTTETIMVYGKEYGMVILAGSCFTIMNMTLNNMIRAEGNARYSMYAIIIGACLNMILDPFFIFYLDMGVGGAAYATVFSQIISFLFLIFYYLWGSRLVTISLKKFSLSKEIYGEIFKVGIATFIRQALGSLSLGFINGAAANYGDAALASIGITFRIVSIVIFILLGYYQGFQPIASYNYGANNFERLRETIRVSLKRTTLFMLISTGFLFSLAHLLITIFSSDPLVIQIGTKSIRAVVLFFPFLGFQFLYMVLFQSLGRAKEALIISLARQGLFLLPSIVILPRFFGLDGVIYSQPTADLFTITITLFFALRLNQELLQKETLFLKKEVVAGNI